MKSKVSQWVVTADRSPRCGVRRAAVLWIEAGSRRKCDCDGELRLFVLTMNANGLCSSEETNSVPSLPCFLCPTLTTLDTLGYPNKAVDFYALFERSSPLKWANRRQLHYVVLRTRAVPFDASWVLCRSNMFGDSLKRVIRRILLSLAAVFRCRPKILLIFRKKRWSRLTLAKNCY